MPHKLQIYPEDDIKWQTLPNYKSVVSCRPFQKNKIIGWKLKIQSDLKLLSAKLRFFLNYALFFVKILSVAWLKNGGLHRWITWHLLLFSI